MKQASTASGPEGSWTIRLYGEFSLTDPNGRPVKLAYRKVEALLALLVLNPEGISRRQAVEALWPDEPSTGLANLRQALHRLKQVVGDPSVAATRDHLGLSSSFRYVSDQDNPELRQDTELMAGHEGTWIEELRWATREGDQESSISRSFLDVLNWYRKWDSEKLELIMVADADLVLCLPPDELLGLVKSLPRTEGGTAWRCFWMASAARGAKEQLRWFARSFELAKRSKDYRLLFRVAMDATVCLMLAGRARPSREMLAICEGIARSKRDAFIAGKLELLRGLVLFHNGEHRRGLEHLRNCERTIGNPIVLQRRLLIRSFLESSVGEVEQGAETLEEAHGAAIAGYEPAFHSFHGLAKLHQTGKSGFERLVAGDAPRFLSDPRNADYPHLSIYVSELVAGSAAKLGDLPLAKTQMARAENLRRQYSFGYTDWDHHRLEPYRLAVSA